MNFDLGRMKRLMEALQHPEQKFPAVHIAGTNGKGSVAKMVAHTLWTEGIQAGLYTSPHLNDLSERFQINGKAITDPELNRLTSHIRKNLKTQRLGFTSLTQFEFLTAIAFLWFAEKNVPVAVVEVGLGGRLDATNVLGNVRVSAITSIGKDHTQWLGKSLSSIAKEKAGILRSGIPVVTAAENPALNVIQKLAQKKKAPIFLISVDDFKRLKLRAPRHLKGPHQLINSAVAAKILNLLRSEGFSLSKWGIIRGIQSARWPGRYEIFRVSYAGNNKRIVLDGAHNAHAASSLVKTLNIESDVPVNLLLGILKDKDVHSMAKLLAPVANRVVATRVPSNRSLNPKVLSGLNVWENRPEAVENPLVGLKHLLKLNDSNTILVAGSLYLMGALRPWVVKHSEHRN